MARISAVKSEDDEVFKTILEFWQYFAKELYGAETAAGSGIMDHGSMSMGGQRSGGGYAAVPLVPPLGTAAMPVRPPELSMQWGQVGPASACK